MICLTFNDLFIFQIVHCFIQASTMNEYFSAFLNLLCMYSVPFLVYLFVRFYLEQGVKLNMMPNAEPRDLEMVSLGKRLGESSDESSWDEEVWNIMAKEVDEDVEMVTLQESIGQSREERNVGSLEDESFFAEEDFERELEDDLKEDFEKIRDRDRSTPTLELDDESKEDRDIPYNQRLDDILFPQTQDTVQTTPYPTKLFVICSILYTFSEVRQTK